MACLVFPHKRAFETEALADAEGVKLAEKLRRKIRSYECDFCHAWHLTKRKRKTRRVLTARMFRRYLRIAERSRAATERRDANRVSSRTR